MEFIIKKRGNFFKAYDKEDPKTSYGSISIKTGKFNGNTVALIPLTEHLKKWKEINTYTPQCINVIEVMNGILSSVRSFPVYNKLEENIQSRNAEKEFLDLVTEYEKPEVPFTDIEEFGDNYHDMNGYELCITWGTLNPVK